jgi:Cu(I)/Ag(I) efflux system membrane fusion protein
MRKQLVVSIAIIVLAGATVGLYAVAGDERSAPAQAGGHNHGAAANANAAAPVRLSPEQAQRIGVTYATAEAGPMMSIVRTVGDVAYDETRLVNVNPKIEGWVEKLYVDFTGAPVQRGQPLMAIYSPMLVSAQEELILARRLLDDAGDGSTAAVNARELLEAARRRLAYWDISPAEVEKIERTRTPQKTVVWRAPASGLVVEKAVYQGQRIMPGMDLYRIADLSQVWLEGDVFEKDLAMIRVGSKANITFEAYPGETFSGSVAYVYPTMTAESRTGRIRIELNNPGLRFKPGMYAKMEFQVPVHRQGIHIPRSAILQTGERTIVFVRDAAGTLTPRQVSAGAATTEHVEIIAGLRAGEVVVASANFLVDAESNMNAALGAMAPANASAPAAPSPKTEAAPNPHAGHSPSAAPARQ